MEHTKHIWRLSLLLILLFTGGILARHFLVPESFGKAGFYRYDALSELVDMDPRHSSPGDCSECHDDKATAIAEGKHRGVQCEVCHDVLATHVQDDEIIGEMATNRSYQLCAYCHEKLTARPSGIAQINLSEHLELDPTQAIADEACLECHDSDSIHSP